MNYSLTGKYVTVLCHDAQVLRKWGPLDFGSIFQVSVDNVGTEVSHHTSTLVDITCPFGWETLLFQKNVASWEILHFLE